MLSMRVVTGCHRCCLLRYRRELVSAAVPGRSFGFYPCWYQCDFCRCAAVLDLSALTSTNTWATCNDRWWSFSTTEDDHDKLFVFLDDAFLCDSPTVIGFERHDHNHLLGTFPVADACGSCACAFRSDNEPRIHIHAPNRGSCLACGRGTDADIVCCM